MELYLLIHSFSEREVFYVALLETMPVAKYKYLCSKFVEHEWKKENCTCNAKTVSTVFISVYKGRFCVLTIKIGRYKCPL